MKVLDLAARHIGQHIRIEGRNLRVQGQLERLTITSRTDWDEMIFPPEPPETRIDQLTVNVAGFRLDLTGYEQVTLLDGEDR
jgi:hypothetical protein